MFAKCPAEDLPEVSLKYSISAVPTFLLLRGGSLLDRVDGANAAELTKKINLQVRCSTLCNKDCVFCMSPICDVYSAFSCSISNFSIFYNFGLV